MSSFEKDSSSTGGHVTPVLSPIDQNEQPTPPPATLDRIATGSSSRLSLTSSYESDTEANLHPEIKLLQEQDGRSIITRRITSIRDQIADDNRSILEEERVAKNDLEKRLKREFSIEDALRLKKTISHAQSRLSDLEENASIRRPASTIEKVFTNTSTGTVDLPPDGGYGWVCCMCAFTILFSTWGNNSAFGVYLSYYINNDVFPGATRMDFAWIAGLIVFCAQFFAPFAMIADRMIGFKLTMSIALVAHLVGYILASFATKLWQLYVCQGVVVGTAYSFLFIPACTIIPNWFLKRRAIASGIFCAGTGLGGLVYSLSINAMIQRTGDQRWSLRMVAIITTVCMGVAIFFIKRRNPIPRQQINTQNFVANVKDMLSGKVLTNPRLWYITFWFSLALLGYNMTLFSYSSSATAMGISQHNASTLTAVMNAAQAVGRPTMGLVADTWVGRINYSMILSIVIVILILGFWVSAKSFSTLIACGALLGFTLGVGNVMNSVLIADAFKPDEFASSWSILNMVMAFFVLFVEVIALALRDDSLSNPFLYAQVFAGCIFTLAVLFLFPLRESSVRELLERLKTETNSDIKVLEARKELGVVHESDAEALEVLRTKLGNYERLLSPTPLGYFKRTFYPVKI